MNKQLAAIVAGISLIAASATKAQLVGALDPSLPYQEIKTEYLQAKELGPTKSQTLDNLREVVKAGPKGQVRLQKVFGNFEGRMRINPAIPGVEKNLIYTASKNPQVVKGAVRNHLYATRVYHDSRFKLLAVDEPQFGRTGKMITDKDIKFVHRKTGLQCRIESKTVKLQSQKSNPQHYKRQIDKMAREFRRTGELQGWLNHERVTPELREYAARRGVPVYEKVQTGPKALARGEPHTKQVLDDFDLRSRALASEMKKAGYTKPSDAAARLYAQRANPMAQARTKAILYGRHSVNRGATAVKHAGTAAAASRNVVWLNRLGKAGPVVAVVTLVISEAYQFYQYGTDKITKREFVTAQASLGSGLAGGLVGMYVGAKLGLLGGPVAWITVPAGAIIGGIFGGVVGAKTGEAGISSYYRGLDETQRREVERAIYAHYTVPLLP